MDKHVFLFLSSILVSNTVSMSRACTCKPNLKEEACTLDYVIIAKVLEERQIVSDDGWVFHYRLNVTKVLKTSASYEEAEKVMQVKLRGNECGGQLKPGHAYIFAGHVGNFLDKGIPRKFLETKFCNYVDFEDLALNEDVFKEIINMIQNPPDCVQSRANEFNRRRTFGIFRKRGRWNHPFGK